MPNILNQSSVIDNSGLEPIIYTSNVVLTRVKSDSPTKPTIPVEIIPITNNFFANNMYENRCNSYPPIYNCCKKKVNCCKKMINCCNNNRNFIPSILLIKCCCNCL